MEKKTIKKALIGIVVSDKMDKTIVVNVEQLKRHKVYKKYIRRSKNFKAHDEKNQAHIGDQVKVIECRPISRHKSFRLSEIIRSAKA